jgi:hypothetical protein
MANRNVALAALLKNNDLLATAVLSPTDFNIS